MNRQHLIAVLTQKGTIGAGGRAVYRVQECFNEVLDMKSALLALGFLATLSAPAFAGPCDTDLAALKTAFAAATAQPDLKTQIQDMVAQAEKLCAEGHAEEAADVIADASSMLSSQ